MFNNSVTFSGVIFFRFPPDSWYLIILNNLNPITKVVAVHVIAYGINKISDHKMEATNEPLELNNVGSVMLRLAKTIHNVFAKLNTNNVCNERLTVSLVLMVLINWGKTVIDANNIANIPITTEIMPIVFILSYYHHLLFILILKITR